MDPLIALNRLASGRRPWGRVEGRRGGGWRLEARRPVGGGLQEAQGVGGSLRDSRAGRPSGISDPVSMGFGTSWLGMEEGREEG